MICAIMQPTYLPWLGYFDLVDSAEKFVFLDNVQLEKSSWQLRNRIKTAQGELFLSISRKKTEEREIPLIKDAEIDLQGNWKKKHLASIEQAYRKALHFSEIFPFVKELLEPNEKKLGRFHIETIKAISKKIGIKTEFLVASELSGIEGGREERVISICKKIKCNEYLSPQGSADYIEKEKPGGNFQENGIELKYHNFAHPEYGQLYGKFLPCMSIIDLMFNEGAKKSLEIIRSGRKKPFSCLELRETLLKN